MFRAIAAAVSMSLGATTSAPGQVAERTEPTSLVDHTGLGLSGLGLAGPGASNERGGRTQTELRREHDQRFIQAIAEFKASGASITVGRTVNVSEDLKMMLLMSAESKVTCVDRGTPLQGIERFAGETRDLPPELRAMTNIRICPLSFVSRQEGDKIIIELLDHLVGDRVLRESIGTSTRFDDRRMQRLQAQLAERVAKALEDRRDRHSAIIDKIAPANDYKPLLEIASQAEPSQLDKAIQHLAQSKAWISLEVSRTGRTAEEHTKVTLQPLHLERIAGRSLIVNGDLRSIAIQMPSEAADVKHEADTVNGEPIASQVFLPDGTIVIKRWFALPGQSEEASRVLNILPPIAFGDLAPGESSRTISLDLSWLGFGSHPLQLTQALLQPVSRTKSYLVYGELGPAGTADRIREALPAAREGAASVEELFGFAPGTLQKRMMLVNSDHINAFYMLNNKGTTFLHDEAMVRPEWALTISRHESLHLVDYEIGETLIGAGRIHQKYEELMRDNPSFFLSINESNFLSDLAPTHAGHAEDNSRELFATFLNGIMSHDWEERIVEAGVRSGNRKAFFEQYAELLRFFQSEIANVDRIPANAPVHTLLAKRLEKIEQLR